MYFGEGSIYHARPDDLIHWVPGPQDQPLMLPTPKGTFGDFPGRPTEVMAQMSYPWLEPSTFEDRNGLVSNVTFVEGLVYFQGMWFAHYGQSDSTLAVATYKVGETYGEL